MNDSYLRDSRFLKQLDLDNLKTYFIKIEVLDLKELPVKGITGRVSSGSININASSSIRRTCNLTFIAEETENDLNEIPQLLGIDKKIKIQIGLENSLQYMEEYSHYPDILWFNQGIYVINQLNFSHSTTGLSISISGKDKMCLLNGECGGGLPTSVTFHEYNQMLEDGSVINIPQKIFDIIQTAVCNYGGEDINKIIINDIDLRIKQIVRYVGSNTLYYNDATGEYSLSYIDGKNWIPFEYNEDIGYVYTDFTFPGELITNIGDNVCTVLDKIKSVLGNYEYFYDVNGNFVFQEIKNYLNNSYEPSMYRLDCNEIMTNNDLCIIDNKNYFLDIRSNTKSVYEFDNNLIISCSNTPNYANIKNDFHIWGKNKDERVIHYHLAIKEKPNYMNTYEVVYEDNGRIRLFNPAKDLESDKKSYTPSDWRAELYLSGLTKVSLQQRPDIYEQELLDLFDSIYDMQNQCFKTNIINTPNELTYFFDYLEPSNKLQHSVDQVRPKVYSYQEDNINRLYLSDVPDIILLNTSAEDYLDLREECIYQGQKFSNVSNEVYKLIAIGTSSYSAQEAARDLLYQYTNYNESITIQTVPIYYLEVNNRITVNDKHSQVYGDYIITSISLPLNNSGSMSITANRVLDRNMMFDNNDIDDDDWYFLLEDGTPYFINDYNNVYYLQPDEEE